MESKPKVGDVFYLKHLPSDPLHVIAVKDDIVEAKFYSLPYRGGGVLIQFSNMVSCFTPSELEKLFYGEQIEKEGGSDENPK